MKLSCAPVKSTTGIRHWDPPVYIIHTPYRQQSQTLSTMNGRGSISVRNCGSGFYCRLSRPVAGITVWGGISTDIRSEIWFTATRYAPVICVSGPLGTGYTWDIAGIKCRDLTADESRQCRSWAGVLMSR